MFNIVGLIISAVIFVYGIFAADKIWISGLIDNPSIAIVVGVTFITLSLTGSLKYFFKSFQLIFTKGTIDKAESEKAYLAVKCAIKTNILTGLLFSAIYLQQTIRASYGLSMPDASKIAYEVLPLVTALAFDVVLNVIASRIKFKQVQTDSGI